MSGDEGLPVSPAEEASPVPPAQEARREAIAFVVAAASWLVPGLGHALLKMWGRAVICFLTVGVLVWVGAGMRGNLSTREETTLLILWDTWRIWERVGSIGWRKGSGRKGPMVRAPTAITERGFWARLAWASARPCIRSLIEGRTRDLALSFSRPNA